MYRKFPDGRYAAQRSTNCMQHSAQGIEFMTEDNKYPEDGEDITVMDTYDIFNDDGVEYAALKNSKLQ